MFANGILVQNGLCFAVVGAKMTWKKQSNERDKTRKGGNGSGTVP
jgi:hypothetical protein